MSDRKLTTGTVVAKIIAGISTLIPLLVVWLVLDFIFAVLFAVGSPATRAAASFAASRIPEAAPVLSNPMFQWLVAIVTALVLLYATGAVASRVIGSRVIAAVEGLLSRIPLITLVYSTSKELLAALHRPQPGGAFNVVFVDSPKTPMRGIGFVMHVFRDSVTGEELAAVLIPRAPRPTTGLLAVIPFAQLVPAALTTEQAMEMIVSGGGIAPEEWSVTLTDSPARLHLRDGRDAAARLSSRQS